MRLSPARPCATRRSATVSMLRPANGCGGRVRAGRLPAPEEPGWACSSNQSPAASSVRSVNDRAGTFST